MEFEQHFNAFRQEMEDLASAHSRRLQENTVKVWWEELEKFPWPMVVGAMRDCRKSATMPNLGTVYGGLVAKMSRAHDDRPPMTRDEREAAMYFMAKFTQEFPVFAAALWNPNQFRNNCGTRMIDMKGSTQR